MNTGGSMSAKIGPLALLAIVVVVVLVGLGAYAYVTIGKYIHTGNQQGLKVESANQTGTLAQLMANITAGFNTTQFAATYAGNATLGLDGLQLTIPVSLGVARYYNDSTISAKLNNIPLIGNFSLVQIKNGSNYYSCTQSLNKSKPGYQCSVVSEANSIFPLLSFDTAVGLLNSTANGIGAAPIHYGIVNQSSHNGLPCTNLNGYFNYSNTTELNNLNLSSKIGQQVSSANMSFLTCVSGQYKVPLTMAMALVAKNGNATTTMTLQIDETSYATSSSSAIAVLPGPIVNSTGPVIIQNG